MMNARRHKNDIPIGESRWIEFIDLDGRYEEAIEIDPFLLELSAMWQNLEQHCVADCCGFDAFDFNPETIVLASAGMDLPNLHRSLNDTILKIEALETTVIVSTRLNSLADKKTFLAILMHIQSCIPSAP